MSVSHYIGSHTAQDPALALFSTTPVLGGDYATTCTLTVDSEISLEEISLTVTIHWLGEFGMFTKLPTVAMELCYTHVLGL